MELSEFECDVALFSDLHRVVAGFGYGSEDVSHLLFALEIELVVRVSHAVFVFDLRARLDAEQDVMSLGVLLLDVVDVVRRDQRDTGLFAEAPEQRHEPSLLFEPLVLDLEVVVSLAEYLEVLEGFFLRAFIVACKKEPRDDAGKAGRKTDQPLAVLPQYLLVYTRFVVVTFNPACGDELYQVLISRLILCQEHQVVLPSVGFFVTRKTAACGHICLAADHRMDAGLCTLLIKIDDAEHDAMVGYGKMLHTELFGAFYDVFDLCCSIEQTILRVQMKVCKGHYFTSALYLRLHRTVRHTFPRFPASAI